MELLPTLFQYSLKRMRKVKGRYIYIFIREHNFKNRIHVFFLCNILWTLFPWKISIVIFFRVCFLYPVRYGGNDKIITTIEIFKKTSLHIFIIPNLFLVGYNLYKISWFETILFSICSTMRSFNYKTIKNVEDYYIVKRDDNTNWF